MRRLIDANALIAALEKIASEDETPYFHLDEITDEIMDAPTVDAVEVVHGRWIHPKDDVVVNEFFCSECDHREVSFRVINPCTNGGCIADENGNFYYPPKMNYCPNCGAKMDGGNEDG